MRQHPFVQLPSITIISGFKSPKDPPLAYRFPLNPIRLRQIQNVGELAVHTVSIETLLIRQTELDKLGIGIPARYQQFLLCGIHPVALTHDVLLRDIMDDVSFFSCVH